MKSITVLLNQISDEEKKVLYKLLNTSKETNEDIISNFSKLLLKIGGAFQTKLTYKEILLKVASHHHITINQNDTEVQIEKALFLNLFKKEYEKMSATEKEEFISKFNSSGLDNIQLKSLIALTAITTVQVSGFGIYLLASSTVGAISSSVGIALPFAFYSSMSKVISVFIGPLGFLILGYPIYKSYKDVKSFDDFISISKSLLLGVKSIFTGDYETATNVVKYFAAIRIMKIEHYSEEIKKNDNKILTTISETEKKQIEKAENELMIQSAEQKIETLKEQLKQVEFEKESKILDKEKIEMDIENLNDIIKDIQNQNSKFNNIIDNLNLKDAHEFHGSFDYLVDL